jgi:hypothetical protein
MNCGSDRFIEPPQFLNPYLSHQNHLYLIKTTYPGLAVP